MDMKRFFLYFITIAALALAGCGGGGGGTSLTVGGERATQVLIDALQSDHDGEETRANTAEGSLNSVLGMLGYMSGDMPTDVEIQTKIDGLSADDPMLAAVRTALMTALGTDFPDSGDLAEAVMMLSAEVAPGMADPDSVAIAPAIAKPIAGSDPPVFGPATGEDVIDQLDRLSPNADGGLTVDGSKVSHTDMKDFMMGSYPPATLVGFDGSVQTRSDRDAATATNPMVTDKVVSYTNQMEPTDTPFAMVHPLNFGGVDDDENNPHTALGVDATMLNGIMGKNGNSFALVNVIDHRPSAGTSLITFGKADDVTVESLMGMFDGASGTYECAATCMITIDTDGKIAGTNAIVGDVTFKPASGVMIPAPDTDYLTFGYWVQTSTPMTGDPTTTIASFATGKMSYAGGQAINAGDLGLSGEAKYSGPATGMFVHKTDVDGDGMGPVATSSGQFTADAKLSAYFGTSNGAVGTNFENAIHGKVSTFTNSSTGQVIEGWELTLNPVKFNTETPPFEGSASGGMNTPMGAWRVSFFGDAADTDEDMNGTQANDPTSVAGEFLGHFSNGHAVGAFGATKDE